MSPSKRCFRIVLCSVGLAGCSGGGGGGGTQPSQTPDPAPVLVAATFVGSGPGPVAGDTLQLLMSEDVVLEPGNAVSDLDVRLADGSLGDVTVSPSLKNPRTVLVTLGVGTTLQPGTTSIAFASGNDCVKDLAGQLATATTPVVIRAGDGDDPTVSALTLSGVDSTLNGAGDAGGTLQVPTSGFTIQVSHGDASSAIAGADSIITASVAVSVDGTSRHAGLDLTGAMSIETIGATTTFTVPATVSVPAGAFELTVYVRDVTGMISAAQSFAARARTANDLLRPFETTAHASQVWFIDTNRDIESYQVNVLNFVTPVEVTNGSNDRPDLEDLFLGLGLFSASPIPGVATGKDSNQVAMDLFRAEVLDQLTALHAGANITFTFTSPGAWIGGASVPYNSHGFSRIALAGSADAPGTSGTLGVAIFDPNNRTQDDDTLTHYSGSQRLGVFLHTLVNDGLTAHPTTLFRSTYDPFTAARFGTPIGDDASDGARLLGVLADGRTTDIANAINRMARFAAVILAHECGHSVGLVMNGAMPVGLYGNSATDFPVFPASAADGHIKMPASLFPGVSENIMSPAFDFDAALAPQTQFNTLNRAYLREQVLAGGA